MCVCVCVRVSGITFGSPVTISMALSDQAQVNEGQVALFYWDPFSNSWAELTGSEFVKVSVST